MNEAMVRARSATFEVDPFPHLIIDNALDAAHYEELAAGFPPVDVVNGRGKPVGSNRLYLLSAIDAAKDPRITAAWKQFFEYPVSAEFWRDTLRLARSHLLKINPDLETLGGRRLEDFRVVVRDKDRQFAEEIALDCQFGINSRVTRRSTVRPPHIDHPSKLFNALLYCRAPDDDTPGGDLILYRCSRPAAYAEGSSVMPTRIVAAKRIAYRANRFVLFLNSPSSVHAVAPRPPTAHVRRYVNMLCEFRQPLFELERLSAIARCSETARAAVSRAIFNPNGVDEVRV